MPPTFNHIYVEGFTLHIIRHREHFIGLLAFPFNLHFSQHRQVSIKSGLKSPKNYYVRDMFLFHDQISNSVDLCCKFGLPKQSLGHSLFYFYKFNFNSTKHQQTINCTTQSYKPYHCKIKIVKTVHFVRNKNRRTKHKHNLTVTKTMFSYLFCLQ